MWWMSVDDVVVEDTFSDVKERKYRGVFKVFWLLPNPICAQFPQWH
jgi:hypothetical protein